MVPRVTHVTGRLCMSTAKSNESSQVNESTVKVARPPPIALVFQQLFPKRESVLATGVQHHLPKCYGKSLPNYPHVAQVIPMLKVHAPHKKLHILRPKVLALHIEPRMRHP
jgi:hypothetical protein